MVKKILAAPLMLAFLLLSACPESALSGTNVDLQSLSSDVGTLSPAFNPATLAYSIDMPVSAPNIILTGLAANPTSVVTKPLTLNGFVAGVVKSAEIVVQAPSSKVKKYTVNVTRNGNGTNADLVALKPGYGTLVPAFAKATLNYTVTVANAVSQFNLTATPADSTATVAYSYSPATTIDLTVGANTLTAAVTAQAGGTPTVYTVVVTRAN